MTHQDKISILITLTIGIFAGAYLYVAGFATTFKLPEISTENIYGDLVLVVESYGQCKEDRNCLSFQLLDDGSYRALFDNPTGGDKIVKEGSIKGGLRKELDKNFTQEALELNSKELTVSGCHFGATSTNYRIRASLKGMDYVMDSCSSTIDYSGTTWQSFVKLWNFFTETD